MHRIHLLLAPALVLGGLFTVPTVGKDEFPVRPRRQPIAAAQPGGTGTPAPQLSDEEALKKADLSPTDGPKLIEYLKQRTLSDADQAKIGAIIERFGADDFDERVKATEEILAFGPAAVGPLNKILSQRDGDPE